MLAEENPALAELDILLQVVADRLADAVVVHRFRYGYMQFLTDAEVVIDTDLRVQNDRRVIQRIDVLGTELLAGETDHLNHRLKIHPHIVVVLQQVVRVMFAGRTNLRD